MRIAFGTSLRSTSIRGWIFMRILPTVGGRSRLQLAFAALALCVAPRLAQAQGGGSVTGRVTNEAGQPLAEARVFLVGTTQIATTNGEGNYALRGAQAGPAEVRVIHVGYAEQKKPVTIPAGSS